MIDLSPLRRLRKRIMWQATASRLRAAQHPWDKHNLEDLDEFPAVEHHYSPATEKWTQVAVCVKLQPTSFAEGAQRQCHRMKVIPQEELVGRGLYAVVPLVVALTTPQAA